MNKRLTLLIITITLLLISCTVPEASDLSTNVTQAANQLSSYHQAITDTQVLDDSPTIDTSNAEAYQLSESTVIDGQIVNGTIIRKDRNQTSSILELYVEENKAYYRQNNKRWQETLTPKAQVENIEMYPYKNFSEVVSVISPVATISRSWGDYNLSFEGTNTELEELHRRIFSSLVYQNPEFRIDIQIDSKTNYIKNVTYRVTADRPVFNDRITRIIQAEYTKMNDVEPVAVPESVTQEASQTEDASSSSSQTN